MIRKITDRIVYGKDVDWAMNIEKFDWIPGVGLYGIFNAYRATGEEKYLEFLNEWANRHLQEAYTKKTINSTAPLLTIVELYDETNKEEYLKVCTDIANWIINEAPLTCEGGLEHTVTEVGDGFSQQIWADTLFMVCLFLVKLGKISKQQKYINFATNQLLIHYKALQDDKTYLCYHGYNCETRNHMSGVFWGRANGWIIYSTTVILQEVNEFIGRDLLLSMLARHIRAIAKFQRNNGMFGTILNDDTAYDEISASAAISAGIKKAVDYGFVKQKYNMIYKKFMDNYKNFVNEDGEVLGVSTGTPIMPSAEDYKKIPICPTLYGQGLMLLAILPDAML